MALRGVTILPLVLVLLGSAPETPSAVREVTHQLLEERVVAGGQIPGGRTPQYLVAPADHLYRILGELPILDEDGKPIALLISYVGDSRDPDKVRAANDQLVEALGLNLKVRGCPAVLIQARVGYDARKKYQRTVALDTSYVLRGDRWLPLPKPPRRTDLPKSIGQGPLELVDDPAYRYDPAALRAAERAAREWLAHVDASDWALVREAMTGDFLSKAGSDWEKSIAETVRIRHRDSRRELFRQQAGEPDRELIEFEYAVEVLGDRVALEQVLMAPVAGRWRVKGYGFRYPRGVAGPPSEQR